MKFNTIKNERLSDRVVREITNLIEAGKLKPGEKLPPETLFVEKLGVSRGVLREALNTLQVQGYIRRKPREGTFIRDLGDPKTFDKPIIAMFKKASYRDLIEMRTSLEQKVAELAIERATDEEILNLEKKLNDAEVSKSSDQDFHLNLAELSKNVLLINFIALYYDMIREIAENNYKLPKRRGEVIEEHTIIIKAIKDRDKEGAKNAIMTHMNNMRKIIDAEEIEQNICSL